jgi:hypothetical protein
MTFEEIRKQFSPGWNLRFARPDLLGSYVWTHTGRLVYTMYDGVHTGPILYMSDFERDDWYVVAVYGGPSMSIIQDRQAMSLISTMEAIKKELQGMDGNGDAS